MNDEPSAPELAPEHDSRWPYFLRLWFGVRERVTRREYAISGFGLMLFKYLVEAAAIGYFAGEFFTPLDFLHPQLSERTRMLHAAPEWLGWSMFVWTLPFVWIAFSMSVRRAADMGISPWFGLLMLLPVFNLAAMLWFAIAPSATHNTWQPREVKLEPFAAPQTEEEYWSEEYINKRRNESTGQLRNLAIIGVSVSIGAAMLVLGVYVLNDYGAALFFGTPVIMGAVCAFLHNCPHSRSWGSTLGTVCLVMLVGSGLLLFLALEGLICIIMMLPLVLPLALFGALLGKAIADSDRQRRSTMLLGVIILPVFAGAESLNTALPEYVVLTSVEIDAPPEKVWQQVVQFPDLPEPDEWFFRLGIASPSGARMEGSGVGAVRYCEFTTGTFVEPITAWDEPRRLAFDVAKQPDPMIELTPFRNVHPPHMQQQSWRSQRGEFLLIELPGGRTRLEGRTWYTFDMWPQTYWTLWANSAIHRIHERVLEHVKREAEKAD